MTFTSTTTTATIFTIATIPVSGWRLRLCCRSIWAPAVKYERH
jgi:hypothetical protein